MEFWVLWFLSFIIVIGTRIAINKITKHPIHFEPYKQNMKKRIILNIFISVCIILTGGIIVAKWTAAIISDGIPTTSSTEEKVFGILGMIFFTLLGCVITYVVGYFILGLYRLNMDKGQEVICVILFIVSIVAWTIPMVNYNKNIEVQTETIEERQEKEVVYFCNIPVQKISGNISGSAVLGSGSVSGEIVTTDNLPYWYINENDEALFDSAPTKSSKIHFIGDDQSPYVEIIHYTTKKTTTNKNNGSEDVEIEKEWTKYIFYMPEEIMQYNLS